ncbi:SDR family oxidoreductase [Bdellovibrio sp. SKB1291214]|uniref:SDR family NAD(P)-dependent oxidoreductase n=1 Tax=Bdellovibrio sp. SKB1291214 TaxID=1732569 RepID=UPI001C3DA1BB|nr:SDR family oxidoreductase [Bdellovibrio sp. SKB1291214]UYL07431.1 SDR family oxidoreductase [Bdellovibrio sp. SKB1291214]
MGGAEPKEYTTVIFVGYALRDEHFLKLLSKSCQERPLFGIGPHFAILNKSHDSLSKSVKQILYYPGTKSDHRSSIQVIEEINLLTTMTGQRSFTFKNELKSAHLIAHLYPPGTHHAGQEIFFENTDGIYAATKAAIRSLARGWSNDLKDRKIRVNTIVPGLVPTEGYQTELGLTPEQIDQFATQASAQIPLGRPGSTDEIAKAVLFLASDDSSYVTGIELVVDGGMTQV